MPELRDNWFMYDELLLDFANQIVQVLEDESEQTPVWYDLVVDFLQIIIIIMASSYYYLYAPVDLCRYLNMKTSSVILSLV